MRTIFSMDAVLRGTQDEYRGLQKAALTHYPPRTPWEVIEIQTATGPLSVMEFSLREILAEIANLRGNGIQPAFVPALRTFSCDLHARATQPKATTYPRWPLSAMFQPATALDVYYLADITLKDFNTGDLEGRTPTQAPPSTLLGSHPGP